MPVDVFHDDNGGVDHHPDCQRDAAERDQVEADLECIHQDEREHQRHLQSQY